MLEVGTGARQHGGQGLVREFCATRFEVAFERLDDDHSLHFNLTHLLSNMDSLEESSSKLTPSLCLAPPIVESPDEKSDAFSEELFRWLDKLEDVLRRVVGSEARVWLCSAVAELVVPHRVQASVFMSFLREAALTHSFQAKRVDSSRQSDHNAELLLKQIVRMLCDSYPKQVGRLLATDDKLLRQFFSGHPKRILGWFQNFAGPGETDHRLGARALSRYAFLHREDYWHELEWKGKHSQAPATVASKPHYFSELDVLRTVDNFLEHVPSFWFSEELRDSLEEGDFLSLDYEFFHNELLERLMGDKRHDLWLLIEEFLSNESFSVLCQRTLHLMSDKTLLEFISNVGSALRKSGRDSRNKSINQDYTVRNSSKDTPWLEMVFATGMEWKNLYDASFSNACASRGREMLKLVLDEEHAEDARALRCLLSERASFEKDHWRLRPECLQAEKWEAVKWLSMEAWLLFHLLSQGSTSAESLERLMTEVGTGFLRTKPASAEIYELISTSKERKRSEKRKRRKPRRRSRKRAQLSDDDDTGSDSDEAAEQEKPVNLGGLSWRLSLDNYTATWTQVDVAEHLVNYAVKQWLQWVTVRW
ncbi:hypothetical protein MPTK2_2g17200 [Marchantia polymorpha subsp. ruderalis]